MNAVLSLAQVQQAQGGVLAADSIPLHFGDEAAEYHAAQDSAVLLDRSHEGRLELVGRDRLAVPHRMSTNALETLTPFSGQPTLFTTPNARILDRAMVYALADRAIMLSEPGRGAALQTYLQRNIFFNDELRLRDLSAETNAFAVHGTQADALMARLDARLADLPAYGCAEVSITDAQVVIGRLKPLIGTGWVLLVPRPQAAQVWAALVEAGLRPAGSLTYNVLRIAAGRPGAGRELSGEYIPLEVGLWDEVSFQKGCYTGQEIIARMESRGKLARTIVRLSLTAPVNAPTELHAEGKQAGTLTSAVTTPNGEHIGIGVLKMAYAQVGRVLLTAAGEARVLALAGAQPPGLQVEEDNP
jgi:aminomethyltransferase